MEEPIRFCSSACANCTFSDCDALTTEGQISIGSNCLLLFDGHRKYSLRIQEETKTFENTVTWAHKISVFLQEHKCPVKLSYIPT